MTAIGVDIPTAGDVLTIAQGPDRSLTGGSVLPVIAQAVNDAWRTDVSPKLVEIIKRELGKGDRFAEGFTLYNIDVRLPAADPAQTIQRDSSGDLLVHVEVGRCTIVATSTQPTFLGSYADPRFSIDVSPSFEFLIDVPPVAAVLGGSKVMNLRLANPHLDSQNFSGDLLLAIGKVLAYFAGTDIDTLIDQAANGALAAETVNASLEPLNTAISGLVDSGHRYLTLLAGDPDDLLRQLGPAGSAVAPVVRSLPAGTQSLMLVCRQPDESGVIEGEISWREGAGEPMDPARAALVSAVAQPFLSPSAFSRLDAVLQGAPPLDVVAELDTERDRLVAVSDGFVAAPVATQLQQSALTGSPGVRLWDASVEPEPPELGQLGFDTVDRATLTLRALQPEAYETFMDIFRRGPVQFQVVATVADPGGGSHRTGRMVAMWHDTSGGWQRRRYRVEGVETGQPLTVTCQLDDQWRWAPGGIAEIAPRNWSGTVTVRKARPLAQQLREGDLQVMVTTADGSHRVAAISVLESLGALPGRAGQERSIIIVGGSPDEVALNPQPLPPRVRGRVGDADERGIIVVGGRAGDEADDRAIIVVGGRPGDEVALNPQPLPPRIRDMVLGRRGDDQAVILFGGRPGDDVALNPQPLPPRWWESLAERVGLNPQPLPPRDGVGGILGTLRRGGGTVLRRLDEGAAGLRIGRAWTRGGAAADRLEAAVEQALIEQARDSVITTVDAFGDLVATIDPDIAIPDTENPVGNGLVRGIDFRVWPRE